MYSETDENGQYQLDCRLDAERDLEENISVMIEFAHKQLEHSVGDNFVKNRYEGYGLLSEHMTGLAKALKDVSNGMTMLSKTLPIDDSKAIDAVASIDNSLADVTKEAVRMAAEARRINDDLYHSIPATTPLEDYMENGDGFQEVDDMPDINLDVQEESADADGTECGSGGTDEAPAGTEDNESEDGE